MSEDAFTTAAIYSFFTLVVVLNGIWMVMKLELSSNRARGWLPSADIREFKLFAARQSNPSKRIAYTGIAYAWRICFVLLFIVPLILLAIGYLVSHHH